MAGHVWAAAALEGNPFTYPEVQTLIEGITVGGHRLSDERQILNLRDGYELLRGLLQDHTFNLDKANSDGLHDAIMKNDALEPGHFRGEGNATTSVLLKESGSVFEMASAYFLFAADRQFYFDGNRRTGRSMMNGLLLAAGIEAVLVPGSARQEFNEKMSAFCANPDGTEVIELLRSCGPTKQEPTVRSRPGVQDPTWKP